MIREVGLTRCLKIHLPLQQNTHKDERSQHKEY
jgi:hypothetical protein